MPWTPGGSDLCSVILGQGGTTWRMADATPPDAQRLAAGRRRPVGGGRPVAGISQGFLVFDDTGTEWTRKGEQFTVLHMPNRFVYSRDRDAASGPVPDRELGPEDR